MTVKMAPNWAKCYQNSPKRAKKASKWGRNDDAGKVWRFACRASLSALWFILTLQPPAKKCFCSPLLLSPKSLIQLWIVRSVHQQVEGANSAGSETMRRQMKPQKTKCWPVTIEAGSELHWGWFEVEPVHIDIEPFFLREIQRSTQPCFFSRKKSM